MASCAPSDPGHRGPVHPRRPRPRVPRDALPRHHQERRVTDQVVQIVKPATGIPGRPTMQLGLRPPYRHLRPVFLGPDDGAGVHRRVFGHHSPSLLPLAAVLPQVAGSPGPGVLRRLRPTRTLRPATDLSPPKAGNGLRMVPTFTAVRSTGEAPGFAPAVSSWLRRRPSPRPARPDTYNRPDSSPPPRSPGWRPHKVGTHRTPAQIHRIRAGRR